MFTLNFAFNLLFWCSQELSSPNFLSPRRLLTEKKGSYISVVECLSYTHEAPGSTPQQCLNQSQKDSLTSSRSPLPPWIQPWGSWWRADSSPVQDSHLHLCIFPELCVCVQGWWGVLPPSCSTKWGWIPMGLGELGLTEDWSIYLKVKIRAWGEQENVTGECRQAKVQVSQVEETWLCVSWVDEQQLFCFSTFSPEKITSASLEKKVDSQF